MKKTIKNIENFKGQKVLIRVDFNVPIENNEVTSDVRINAALPTINYVIEKGGKAILFSHLGRVKTEEDKSKTLKPVAKKLEELINKKVIFSDFTKGAELEEKINLMEDGEILLVENTRFEDLDNNSESNNNPELGKYWASLGDIFVNDAFGTSHRSHASNVGIATNIKESVVGLLVEKELKFLGEAINEPKRPFIALLGGAKVSDKIEIIKSLLEKADKVIIGPAMVYTFDLVRGKSIGNSLSEPDKTSLAKELMEQYPDKLILSEDSVYTEEYKDVEGQVGDEVPEGMIGMDSGPKTTQIVKEALEGAKTIIWNGPFGVTEFENYKKGSEEIAKAIVSIPDATTIVGGGDSAAMAFKLGLEDKFTHISTGGGAAMKFLEGKELPGIAIIKNI